MLKDTTLKDISNRDVIGVKERKPFASLVDSQEEVKTDDLAAPIVGGKKKKPHVGQLVLACCGCGPKGNNDNEGITASACSRMMSEVCCLPVRYAPFARPFSVGLRPIRPGFAPGPQPPGAGFTAVN